jgi:hypothetical protein
MSEQFGDVKINGKWYKIETPSYQARDVTDFSPRASTPGGSVVHSELTLYQPQLQTDWKHGFGFNWFEDASGYMKTVGNIDTRHDGIAMMFTNKTSSDTDNYNKEGFCVWENNVYAWGTHGLRKYDSATDTWSQAQDVADTDEGSVVIQPASADAMILSNAATTKYGSNVGLYVGEANDAAQIARSLIKFDLSNIPTNATITSAVLSLYMASEKSSNDRSIYAYRMLKDWQEASVTYNKYDATNDWGTAGGFAAADCEQTDIGNTALVATETVGWKDITLTAAEVQDWTDGTMANYGMMLKMATETSDQYRFHSSNYATDTTLHPKLTVTYTTPSLSSTGVVNYAFPAGDFLFYLPDGARIRKISKEGLDSFTGNDNTSIDFKHMLAHKGYYYVVKDNSTMVHRDSTNDLTDLEGTSADTDVIHVGVAGSYPVKMLQPYAGSLYAGKADGLWLIDDTLIATRIIDFSSEVSEDNFRSMAVHNGYLLFPIRDRVYQWNGARMSDVTPPRLTDTFPYTTYGRFDNFVSVGRFLYCTARTNETTYSEDLICFDGVAWHKLMTLVSNGTDSITAMNYDAYNNRLWYHLNATADVSYYIQMQNTSEFPYGNYPTTGTHELYMSRWDMGYRWVQKTSPTLTIEASNLTADRYLKVYYSLDGADFVEWDSVTANGITRLTTPGGNQAVEFYHMVIKIQFVTAIAAQSPILEGVTLRFLMRPITVDGWSFNIPLADGQMMNVGSEGRSSKEMIQDLRDARDNTGAVEFTDIDGSEYYVHVTSFTRRMVEKNLWGGGASPDLEFIAAINLVRAT